MLRTAGDVGRRQSMTDEIQIERALPGDLDAVLALLARHGLPPDGLCDHVATMLVARRGGRVVGSAALEMYREGALLRSVAVDPGWQARGIGARLTDAAIALGESLHAPAIYLLTTTADEYFPRHGFTRVDRDAVPDTVRASVEFTSACPSTATVMRRALPN